MQWAWTCRCCGKQFDTLPLDWCWEAPFHWPAEPSRELGDKLDDHFCAVGEHRFVRGCLEIPIVGTNDLLVFGVWGSLSQTSFERVVSTWSSDDGEGESFFSWFSNRLPETLYPDTLSLQCRVHLRGRTTRPRIELAPTDHPLAVEQRHGISIDRVIEIATALMPRH